MQSTPCAAPSPKKFASPDATASVEIADAMHRLGQLISLAPGPYHGKSSMQPQPRELYNWEIVAPAMVFSAVSCALSLISLAGADAPRREQDAFVLTRRLFEHLIQFSWIAIDPTTHCKRWVDDDTFYRVKTHKRLNEIGKPQLDQTQMDELASLPGKKLPNLLELTKEVAAHWDPILQTPRPDVGFELIYAVIYPYSSLYAHPSPRSLSPYVVGVDADGTFRIGFDKLGPVNYSAYTLAPTIMALLLLVSSRVQGFPKAVDVKKIYTANQIVQANSHTNHVDL